MLASCSPSDNVGRFLLCCSSIPVHFEAQALLGGIGHPHEFGNGLHVHTSSSTCIEVDYEIACIARQTLDKGTEK